MQAHNLLYGCGLHPGHRGRGRSLVGRLLLLACPVLALYLCPASSRAAGPVMVAIEEIPREGLFRETFTLTRDVDVDIEAVASGWPEEGVLFSYAWILDLRSRKVVWKMDPDEVDEVRHDNVHAQSEVRLPAGDYALYFSALGGSFPIRKTVKFLKLLELGTVKVEGGVPAEWDRYGQPSKWGVTVRARDESFDLDDIVSPARPPADTALLRIDRVESVEFHRALLEVSRDVRLHIRALGEYVAREQGFADGAWVEGLGSCGRIWEMTLTNTRPAGGAKKNRMFEGEVAVKPGRYMVCYATDDSHAFDRWNAQPPWDPEAWGLTIEAVRDEDRAAIKVTEDPPDPQELVRIDRVTDSAFRRVGFELDQQAAICIHALGEWGSTAKRFLDYGWIEDARTLLPVWTMQDTRGTFAGGETRNRLVTDQVSLGPGAYFLCYLSDEAHSYALWHKHPPHDPESWGIQLRAVGSLPPGSVRHFNERGGPVSIIRIAPVGDDIHKRVRFDLSSPLTVRIIALGEGTGGEMHDYAWLIHEDDQETVWRMQYSDTRHAGGARKNRRCERVLTLEAGAYALHYRSDGSHSFEKWNADPPEEPHLWGVTLLEVAEEAR